MVFDDLVARSDFLADPYPTYHRMRSEAPIFYSERWGGWVLTRHRDVVETKRDHQRFSNGGRFAAFIRKLPEAADGTLTPLFEAFDTGIIHRDPPKHAELRRIVMKAFNPRAMRALSDFIEDWTDRALATAEERGEFDMVADLAEPLPCTVVAKLVGVAPQMQGRFKAWADDITGFLVTPDSETTRRALGSVLDARAWLTELIEARRRFPENDLISAFANEDLQGIRMSTDDVLSTARTFMVAGHGTTTSLLAVGTLALLQHPKAMIRLRRLLDTTDPAVKKAALRRAIEEMMRFESPLQRDLRICARDLEFRGQPMKAGDLVVQVLGAAHRDPEVFERPDAFDPERSSNRHLAFGVGIHACIGATLARLEAEIVFEKLLCRFRHIELVEPDIDWERSVVRLPKRLRLRVRA